MQIVRMDIPDLEWESRFRKKKIWFNSRRIELKWGDDHHFFPLDSVIIVKYVTLIKGWIFLIPLLCSCVSWMYFYLKEDLTSKATTVTVVTGLCILWALSLGLFIYGATKLYILTVDKNNEFKVGVRSCKLSKFVKKVNVWKEVVESFN